MAKRISYPTSSFEFFKTESPEFDEGLKKGLLKNGIRETMVNYIDPSEISLIRPFNEKDVWWYTTLLSNCTTIILKNGYIIHDNRPVDDVLKALRYF